MFGYLKTYNPYLYGKDDVLYKALYCGICKSISSTCGQMARMGLTYDIAFLSAFVHNIKDCDVKIEKKHCVLHPISKRPIANIDEISQKLAYLNTIMVYYKIKDDKKDGKKVLFRNLFISKGYKKAKNKYPELDEIVKRSCDELAEVEKNKIESVDISADSTACMLKDVIKQLLKDDCTEYIEQLMYYVGKWIYLIDALDDYDKDNKKGNYNPFCLIYKDATYAELLNNHKNEILFIFNDIICNIKTNYEKVSFKFNKDLIENILTKGIINTTNQILNKGIKNNA